jgi:hypothetical protein
VQPTRDVPRLQKSRDVVGKTALNLRSGRVTHAKPRATTLQSATAILEVINAHFVVDNDLERTRTRASVAPPPGHAQWRQTHQQRTFLPPCSNCGSISCLRSQLSTKF